MKETTKGVWIWKQTKEWNNPAINSEKSGASILRPDVESDKRTDELIRENVVQWWHWRSRETEGGN